MLSGGSPWGEGSPCRHRSGGRELPSGEALYPRCQHAGPGTVASLSALGSEGFSGHVPAHTSPQLLTSVPTRAAPLSQLGVLKGSGPTALWGARPHVPGEKAHRRRLTKAAARRPDLARTLKEICKIKAVSD